MLELIGRRPLGPGGPIAAGFRSSEIACVSEVGLSTEDVPALVRDLVVATGLLPFGDVADGFAPMGDHEGLLIVVDRDRPWFPEGKRLPGARGIELLVEGVLPGVVVTDGEGWRMSTATSEAVSPGKRMRGAISVW